MKCLVCMCDLTKLQTISWWRSAESSDGPFCGAACHDVWITWTEADRLERVFGNATRARLLLSARAQGHYQQDEAGPVSWAMKWAPPIPTPGMNELRFVEQTKGATNAGA